MPSHSLVITKRIETGGYTSDKRWWDLERRYNLPFAPFTGLVLDPDDPEDDCTVKAGDRIVWGVEPGVSGVDGFVLNRMTSHVDDLNAVKRVGEYLGRGWVVVANGKKPIPEKPPTVEAKVVEEGPRLPNKNSAGAMASVG